MKIDENELKKKTLLGAGKMAEVYKDTGRVFKIYKGESPIGEGAIEKLSKLNDDRFIFPDELIYGKDGDFIGYTMPYINGEGILGVVDKFGFEELYSDLDELKKSIISISNKGIAMSDAHEGNYFYDKDENKIKIIDTDFYVQTESECQESNLNRNDDTLRTILGINKEVLKTYINNNDEIQSYIECATSKLGKRPDAVQLMKKIQEVAESEFGRTFENIGELKAVIQERELGFEENIEEWSEGNDSLYNALLSARKSGVKSQFCCAGHKRSDSPYISFEYTERTEKKLHSVLNDLMTYDDIEIRLANTGKMNIPSLTIYTKNNERKNQVFDSISQSIAIERDIEGEYFPEKIKSLIEVADKLQESDMQYSVLYNLDKRIMELSSLKDESGRHPKYEEMVQKGYKGKEDLFGVTHYLKKIPKKAN